MGGKGKGTQGNAKDDFKGQHKGKARGDSQKGKGWGWGKGKDSGSGNAPAEVQVPEIGYDWVDAWHAADTNRHRYTVEEWKNYFFNLSKKLSYILRHGAAENDLILRSDASIAVEELLVHRTFSKARFCKEDIQLCVENNSKKRFLLFEEEGVQFIRAQQGHTRRVGEINQAELNDPVTAKNCPQMAVHGTFRKNVDSIREQGLKTMGRDHIHMATGLPGDNGVISGCKEGTDVFMHIDVKRALASGIKFFMSGNRVLLTPGRDGVLPPEFIRGATNATGDKVLFGFEDNVREKNRTLKCIPGSGEDAAKPNLKLEPLSNLSASERSFLKAVKDVRAILKIEERRQEGKSVDKMQLEKLKKKDQYLAELREQLHSLAPGSPLREKNQDVLSALPDSS